MRKSFARIDDLGIEHPRYHDRPRLPKHHPPPDQNLSASSDPAPSSADDLRLIEIARRIHADMGDTLDGARTWILEGQDAYADDLIGDALSEITKLRDALEAARDRRL